MPIDFTFFHLKRIADKEYTSIPGALVDCAGKSSHRHRQEDLFAIHLDIGGDLLNTEINLQEQVEKARDLFFHSQGSVTRAIQTVIEKLNKEFYAINAGLAIQGEQIIGSINICVLHKGWLFIGQVGDAYIYHIGENVFDIFGDDRSTQEKLGLSRSIQIDYHQCALNPGDLLLMSPRTHGSWKSYYLSNSHKVPTDQLKRRLYNQMVSDFYVVIIKAHEGTGRIIKGEWKSSVVINEDPLREDNLMDKKIVNDFDLESISKDEPLSEEKFITSVEANEAEETHKKSTLDDEALKLNEGETEAKEILPNENQKIQVKQISDNKMFYIFARLWMRGKTVRAKIGLNFARIKRKIFPNKKVEFDNPTRWQSLAVILVPLLIIIGSLKVFSSYGKDEQYDAFMSSAIKKSNLAEEAVTSIEKKDLWTEVLETAIKAEEYQITNESRQLITKAQTIVDRMDLTRRLSFRPAMTQPFPDDTKITMIKDSSTGIYMLDSSSGNVLRVFTNSKGFLELDDEFRCTPGNYGLVEMGAIVDFIVLPANNKSYKILAIDNSGNLLYCQPGKPPDSRTLTIPERGWGKINRMIYTEDQLLVVDPVKNDILIYGSNSNSDEDLDGIVFVEMPTSFFNKEVPDIGGVIGASINQNDLYLLHEDGHMTLCQYGDGENRSTECEDPIPFTDTRTSSENKKPWIFMGTKFSSIDQATLPNPSILILDEISGTIFQFSMQLNLDVTLKPQINPDFPLPASSPTGFGILLDQELLLAYNNQLFTTPLQ